MTNITAIIRSGITRTKLFVIITASLFALTWSGCTNETGADLKSGFENPPEYAKPRVWWHWMNGNITKEGIRADLEWMKRTGIGGFQNFDAGLATPRIVEKRLIYMTPEWKDAFLFATKLADSLGLEMAIAGSPGWSESGGPWVTPAQAMKKIVWSETRIEGGKPFRGILPKPPSVAGAFQNIPARNRIAPSLPLPEFYADAAVVACRIPPNEIPLSELRPEVTSSGGRFTLAALTDGDLLKSEFLPAARPGINAWIRFNFSKPVTIQSLTLYCSETGINYSGPDGRVLESSDDGIRFKAVFTIPVTGNLQRTFTFEPVTARYFRLSFRTPPQEERRGSPPPAGNTSLNTPAPQPGVNISEAVLHTAARVNRFEDKAGFSSAAGLYSMATPDASSSDATIKTDVIDLTPKMLPDGTLEWTPPEGRWSIIRLGYSLTGHQNAPASPEATGLETDKLSAVHVRSYFSNYLDQYKDATGGLMGSKGLQFVISDSWEAGVQNWTDKMMDEFRKNRGYDMLPWLPALTGRIVESAEASDRFLWDFRRTISDLTAVNHYDLLTTMLHERNMRHYTESHESGRAFIGDGMEAKRSADIPMSATWTPPTTDQDDNGTVAVRYRADVRESASVAHIYGQNIVAAESMTARGNTWAFSPERLKPTADMELASGLNRFVIHTSVHQPVSDKIPGLGLGPYGQWFTRHETWAEQALPWITYLSRSSFMLQQGKFVADILYYYGEDNNITAIFGNKLPDIPESYNYDFVNADALVNMLSVKDGNIITPGGMSYRILILDENSRNMSLPVIKKIRKMVEEGAVIAGPAPLRSPSLSDDQSEFRSIVSRLWPEEKGQNNYGKGKIISGMTAAEALSLLQVAPDFEYSGPSETTNILFVHRMLPGIDIYWVNNRNNRQENVDSYFRVKDRAAEIWHPETGKTEMASYSTENGKTKVPLQLSPNDAVFVIFRKSARKSGFTAPKITAKQLTVVDGAWKVSFQPDRGAPPEITMENLTMWNEYPDPGVKYFSGTGTYTKVIQAPSEWFGKKGQLWLDLGIVRNLAELTVNGRYVGIVWKRPFRFNVTDVLKPGENTLKIRVTNLWVNRLIGDQQPGDGRKYTYTTQAFYQAESPLLPSGLAGPVTIINLSEK